MKKILVLLVVLGMVFCCSVPAFAVSPENGDALPEEVVDLYRRIPGGAYGSKRITFLDLPEDLNNRPGPVEIFFELLMEKYSITPPETEDTSWDPADYPDRVRIPREEVIAFYDGLWGEGSLERAFRGVPEQIWDQVGLNSLVYEAATDSYVYVYQIVGGGERLAHFQYIRYLRMEESGDELYLYDVAGRLQLKQRHGQWEFYFDLCTDDDPERQQTVVFRTVSEEEAPAFMRSLKNGELDDILPIYKHTFCKNAEGGWYWVSSEPVNLADRNPGTADGGVGLAAALTLCGGAALCAVAVLRRRKVGTR